jgi:hypothetical protein
MMTANEVEYDAAIDIPSGFARGDLEIAEIDLSHRLPGESSDIV